MSVCEVLKPACDVGVVCDAVTFACFCFHLVSKTCPSYPSCISLTTMRPPQQPLTKKTANPNAATAAASAFMRREPSTSLSSAAAAAALKARPTTPTNVAQTATKRTQRRSASVSSAGSRDRGRRELQRTPSNGSMSERTFRSPSPGRSPAPKHHHVPPVPKLPSHEQYRNDDGSPATHRRAISLQTQPFRTASQKMKDGQGGSWFGAATTRDTNSMRRSAVLDSPHLDDPRSGSTSPSINFSYPRSRIDSFGDAGDQTLVYDANSRRMVPRESLLQREQEIRNASEKPVKKKKAGVARGGSHLAKGTVARPRGTAVDQSSPIAAKPASPIAEPILKQREIKPSAPPEHRLSREHTLVDSGSEIDEPGKADLRKGDGATILPPPDSPRAPVMGKTPSVVEEDPELESELDRESESEDEAAPVIASVTSPPPTLSVPPKPEPKFEEPVQAQQQIEEMPEAPSLGHEEESSRRARVPSVSPARTTHFAPTADQLTVRHEPPPRSLSPRKSALKQRSPTRSTSPSEDGSDLSNLALGARPQDEQGPGRKKSVRVSFDHNTVVVGESAEPPEPQSPIIASPQTKKTWHNLLGRQKKEPTQIEEEETMTPRPALPSFGSVRDKKTKETEERPLVRPLDLEQSPQPTPTPPRRKSPTTPTEDLGQSSDMAIGSLLAQEQSSRNAANISKYREPLPPVVTSVESNGYISNTPSGSEDEWDAEPGTDQARNKPLDPSLQANTTGDFNNPLNGSTTAQKGFSAPRQGVDEHVPTISIIGATPGHEDKDDTPQQEYFDVPGGFPNDDSNDGSEQPRAQVSPPLARPSAETELALAPSTDTSVSELSQPATPKRAQESTATATPNSQMDNIEEESTDGSSIYSDAYEDLSDLEGDGFMSLDAVLNPTSPKASLKLYEKTVAKSKEAEIPQHITPIDERQTESPSSPNDWESAKLYWKSLSSDKRRQLEKEAMEEAGEDADLDQTPQQKKKMKKRKSLDQPRDRPEATEETLDSRRVYQIQPGTKWSEDEDHESPTQSKAKSKVVGSSKLRKSLRGEQTVVVEASSTSQSTMRKSMRGPAPAAESTGFRKSMRSESEAPAATNGSMRKSLRPNGNASRPVSYQPAASAEIVKSHKRNQSADARPASAGVATSNASVKPGLTRRGSDDSESSFRRVRPSGGQGFGFRSTMRANNAREAPAASEPVRGSGRFSLRSLSPSSSTFRRGTGASSPPPPLPTTGFMRGSMRTSSEDVNASRSRLSGFGRSSGKKTKKTKGSRFADSSDEDEAQPRFNSRFADSSDEEDVAASAPKSNGLPKTMRASSSAAATAMGVPAARAEDEESSDLPDSDDEATQRNTIQNGLPASKLAAPGLNRSGSGRGSLAPSPPSQALGTLAVNAPRPNHSRRGSFMSILGRRKKDPVGKISRSTSESAARRDTHLERPGGHLAVIRSNSSGNTRLQKRGPNWPLTPIEQGDQDDEFASDAANERPSTSGGATSGVTPGFLKRRSLSHGGVVTTTIAADQQQQQTYAASSTTSTHKKKKFGVLRKMFRLND